MWFPKLCFYQRLAISLVAGFFTIIAVLTIYSTYLQQSMQHEAEQRLHLGLAEHLVSDNPILKEGVYDYKALNKLFHTLMLLGPNFEFYFLDPQGNLLTYSAKANEIVRKQVDVTPINVMLSGGKSFPNYGDDPKDIDKQKIFSVAPVYNDDSLQGYLYIIIGGAQYDSITDSIKSSKGVQQYILIVLAGLIFLMFVLLVLFKFFTAPLKKLSDDMDRFRGAGFDIKNAKITLLPWRNDSRNEVQRLGYSFNEMLRHIDKQWQQIKLNDLQRRTLLADLSHDLRTPLANMQGYMETLCINDSQLTSEQRDEFFGICTRNLHNLKRLIDQIFELAYLEGGHVNLKMEPCLLAELLHDIAAKFNLQANAKDIGLTVDIQTPNAYVKADIEKLERVLTNLIDNAIRHTPAGGSIQLQIKEANDKLVVSVRDSGIGIAAEELEHIFVARYQATNSQKGTKTHVGLGLAISQKLIALFDSTLEVTSEIGKGTSFSFTLQQAKA
ncbi:sensor histidine kinase [Glaciecola sp. 1036]|uniref:sensor histidine kinase n=1 Tax=Alteromonadaceae TaxID=72275 RepID=UPI003CFEA874